MQSIPKSRRIMAIMLFDTPCRVSNKCSRTAGATKALSGRVTFLPLAGAGMPKTSFRKNSDSPKFSYLSYSITLLQL
jgi:hypothetical protein